MAVERNLTFGERTGIAAVSTTDQKKASPTAWLNIGYETNDEDYPFVSLPMGIGVDTMDPVALRGQNADFNEFSAHRNKLLELLQNTAAELAPGESCIINLQVQLRRVNDAPTVEAKEDSRFAPPAILFQPPAQAAA